jgi:chaperonin GroES
MNGEEYCLIAEKDVIGCFPKSGATAADIQHLHPLGDRVLLKCAKAEERTAGGLLLPDAAKEQPVVGTVRI